MKIASSNVDLNDLYVCIFLKFDLLLFKTQQKISILKTMTTDYPHMRSNCNMKSTSDLLQGLNVMIQTTPRCMSMSLFWIKGIINLDMSLPTLVWILKWNICCGKVKKKLSHKILWFNSLTYNMDYESKYRLYFHSSIIFLLHIRFLIVIKISERKE